MATATSLSPQETLERARALIVLNHPFYSVLLLNTRTRISDSVPTAAASINEIIVNPEWFGALQKQESVGVLLHEVLHTALSHLTRRGNRNILVQSPEGQTVTLWNIAADIVVNSMLLENGHKLPQEGCFDTEGKYKSMSVEQVYEKLEKDLKKNKNSKSAGQQMSGYKWSDQHIEGRTGPAEEGEENQQSGQGSQQKDDLNIKELSESEHKKEQQRWQGVVEAAATAQRMSGKGDLPTGIQKSLDELLRPKVKWNQILPYLLSTYIPYDYSEVAFDRRLIAHGIYISDLSDTKAQVAVALDTSGSISDDDINQFLSEAMCILRGRNVSSVRLLTCDADVHEDIEMHSVEDRPVKVSGRGGTSFVPVFRRLEDKTPQLLVYLTDGMGDYPKDPPSYPVLWILTQHLDRDNQYYPKFGFVAYLEP